MAVAPIKEIIIKEIEEIPEDHLEALQKIVHQYSISLKKHFPIHPEVAKLQGLLPSHINARQEYYQHQLQKHA